jgi:hypothetical protein
MTRKALNPNKKLRSYIIGLALGDGNLSNPNGRAIRLRITCDKKYPLLIKRIFNSLKLLFPDNKVSIVDRDRNCLDVSVYSNYLEELLGWKAEKGPKFVQNVSVPMWIKENYQYKICCLRGLIETDGCVYSDRNYRMINFTTIIPKLAKDVKEIIISLGFSPHLYELKGSRNTKYSFIKKPFYHIRISKNTDKFLDLVKPEKA